MDFSDILRDLRKEKQLTQKELAAYLGLTANSVCEWENKRSEPSMAAIIKMCSIFEVSTDYLLGRSDDLGNVTVQSSSPALPQDERELLKLFRVLPPEYKQLALNTLRTWTGSADREEKQKKA